MKYVVSENQLLIINKIKKIREDNEWSMKEFASLTGLTAGFLADIECGRKKNMGKDSFEKLISYLIKKEIISKNEIAELSKYWLQENIPESIYNMLEIK